jgi:hypothetical protein
MYSHSLLVAFREAGVWYGSTFLSTEEWNECINKEVTAVSLIAVLNFTVLSAAFSYNGNKLIALEHVHFFSSPVFSVTHLRAVIGVRRNGVPNIG